MAVDWINAPQAVVDLASELIDLHHPTLKRARIGILFRSEAPISNGKATWGKAQKVDAKWKPLLTEDLDFIIWLAHDSWMMMDERQRRALLDHELCHCRLDKDDVPYIRPHDIEEFGEVVYRHGLWRSDVEAFASAIQGVLLQPERDGFVRSVLLETARTINEEWDDVEASVSFAEVG